MELFTEPAEGSIARHVDDVVSWRGEGFPTAEEIMEFAKHNGGLQRNIPVVGERFAVRFPWSGFSGQGWYTAETLQEHLEAEKKRKERRSR